MKKKLNVKTITHTHTYIYIYIYRLLFNRDGRKKPYKVIYKSNLYPDRDDQHYRIFAIASNLKEIIEDYETLNEHLLPLLKKDAGMYIICICI